MGAPGNAEVLGNLAPLLLLNHLGEATERLHCVVQCWQIDLEATDERVGACVDVVRVQVLFDGRRFLGVGAPSQVIKILSNQTVIH